MAYKKSLAIIGAATHTGAAVARSMFASYRLLLMDSSAEMLASLEQQILHLNKSAEVEAVLCSKEASWEADIIVVAVNKEQLQAVAEKVKDVTTCKPVVHFISDTGDTTDLQTLLPHAKVVDVWLSNPLNTTAEQTDAVVRGTDAEALATAQEILTQTGCQSSAA